MKKKFERSIMDRSIICHYSTRIDTAVQPAAGVAAGRTIIHFLRQPYMKRIKILSMSALLTVLGGCSFSMPFKWIEDNPSNGGLIKNQDQEVLVTITHATVDSAKRKMFDQGANRVLESLPTQPGLIAYSVRRQLFGNELWTATVWANEEAMLQFVRSPAHLQAVKEGNPAIIKIDYTRLQMRRSELPPNWSRLLAAAQKKEQTTP